MNPMFALKGVVILFIFTVLCRFVLALPLSMVTTQINTQSVAMGVDAQVGPVLAMIANVFTAISCLFGIAIVIILIAIAFQGEQYGGEEIEGNPYTRM